MSLIAVSALVAVCAVYVGGLTFAVKGHTRQALACAIVAGAISLVYGASEPALHEWDERYHALVAKHLAEHPLTPTLYDDPVRPFDYRDWTRNSVWLHKPPFTLWMMAASVRVFGLHPFAVRLPSIVCGLISIGLTFSIARKLVGEQPASVAALFQSVNGFVAALVSGRAPTDHVDVALMLCVEVGVWLILMAPPRYTAIRVSALGVVLGVAILTKWFPGLVLVPLWALWDRPKSFKTLAAPLAMIGGFAVAVFGPWTAYTFVTFPREAMWEFWYSAQHALAAVETQTGGPFFYVAQFPKFFGELTPVAVIAALWAWHRTRDRRLGFLLAWVGIPYVVFSMMATKMQAYTIIAAPAIFTIGGWFWCSVASYSRRSSRRWAVVALAAVLAALPARYLLRPGGPYSARDRNPTWAGDFEKIRQDVDTSRAVIFNVEHPIEAMFELPWPVYEGLPSAGEVAELSRRGYSVWLWDGSHATRH